jgi:Type I restriction enzyme R protein N terminus (HSDR_N)
MELLKLKNNGQPTQLYCKIRKEWVAATPEEKVRQQVIEVMVGKLDYSAGGVVLEKSLRQMPHLALYSGKLPNRRADIVFFAKDVHPSFALYPALLIECKSVALSRKVFNQVLGYNHYLKAYFVAVANHEKIQTGWYDPAIKQYRFIDGLPSFSQLISQIR